MTRVALAGLLCVSLWASEPYSDGTYSSKVFAGPRNYRVFLPASYATSGKHYPVIYYFHGHSDRYTLEAYDKGLDTVPKIASFVRNHEAIVVAADGYVARDYQGFYGGSPYDVRIEGGDYDFGEAFLELVSHIDSTYRTLTGRRYRSTSGLSMGGFMSLYLSARYPDLIGSASAFNPGPEFFVGEKGRRSLWRPKDHVRNHESTMVRLIRASGDYISQYHEETRAAYTIAPTVDFEYRQDEYHRHWATSIEETFAFHTRAHNNPALDTPPVEWNYSSAFRRFSVRGYEVTSDAAGPTLIQLEQVRQSGFRISSRQWAPDGPAAQCSSVSVTTAPLYEAGKGYEIVDVSLHSGKMRRMEVTSDASGRLQIQTDCAGHLFSIDAQPLILLPLTSKDVLRVLPGTPVHLPVRLLSARTIRNLRVELISAYPTVEVIRGRAERNEVAAGSVIDLSPELEIRFASGATEWAHARLELKVAESKSSIDVLIAPRDLSAPLEVTILDGRAKTFTVFRQKGNQGGGSAIERTVTEGEGNGDGILQPGERATIWVKLRQGLDAFDRGNWYRAKIYSDSPWLSEVADIQEDKQREWTGARNRTSLVELSRQAPPGAAIPMILDCESWSFHYTPDVRYGREPLYQAFQLHKHHLFRYTGVR